ncbi:excinuclease ABC subunit UvrA [Marinigracilibium pacificum]|uniref:UvrABC system protein A n=1 Tax=Marinigracilibium pacificum TaxID=2729599 RepID=A0A848J1H2_9BACT|nr:excinuclease ABC subunit UvrA [Marinigracilibium pacificum]NMM47072.1 excinuclease ABC subunit UvrA [Marinigracilibium pacificum]
MSKIIATELDKIDSIDPKKFIVIKNARVNNLHNLSVSIPRNKLVVVTGLSGSGKSSLAFDTLFAEGQRMYVESLSSYARQFLGRMEKPEVDYIKGVSPAIAIEQKVNTRNPRSTVGTTTEIYDYLKLLFARVGKTFSPISGNVVQKSTVEDVLDFIYSHGDGERLMIMCPLIPHHERSLKQELEILLQKGYNRVIINDSTQLIEDLIENIKEIESTDNVFILLDRATVVKDPEASDGRDEDNRFRLADSIETAFFEGHGDCIIEFPGKGKTSFSDRFEADGIVFEEPTVNLFSFNNPYGACKRCEGFGKILGIDPDLVIPNKNMSVFEGAIVPWRSETMKKWLKPLIDNADQFDFPIHRSIKDLSDKEYNLLWTGNEYFEGLDDFFSFLESKSHKIQYRVMLSRYRGRTVCPDCRGTRLRKDASYVKINETSITDVVLMSVEKSYDFFNSLELGDHDQKIANRLLKEVINRLGYLNEVGLGYLTLNRLTSTLSGGEYQRIKLATSLGSALVGSMYILDEPSIGLHPRDTERLIGVLKNLRDLGNTVIVVEHEEDVIRAADQIIDIGPDAGVHGGTLVFQGTADQLSGSDSYTAKYLSGQEVIAIPGVKRKWRNKLTIIGARENNLKNINVDIPLGVLSVITGVSGSGKSTLVKKILYPALSKHLEQHISESTGKFDRLEGDLSQVKQIEFIDQNPIGKSSRSNPVTYVKAYDAIRQLFADQQLSKQRGFKPAHFSFNVEGGRCETCQGEGEVKIEMQFMADIHLTCETCKGRRFKDEVLEVKYNDKSISDVLDLTVEESLDFFAGQKAILNKLEPLNHVGLGYIKLGQSSNSLSGGEAQRVKLASFLSKGGSGSEKILFVFDEPTTGLHFHDIKKLLTAINALIEQGNSVVIIEHNMEIIKSADWIIDLGPEGGENGGNLVFAGKPEDLVKVDESHTARFLKEKFN